jgi:hypothetical protein
MALRREFYALGGVGDDGDNFPDTFWHHCLVFMAEGLFSLIWHCFPHVINSNEKTTKKKSMNSC